jgi:hypothetical protein
VGTCPEETCTVAVTPRHCRKFKPKPGETFGWTNTSLKDGKVVGSGPAAADRWGLVTVTGLEVSKGRNRIRIERQTQRRRER